MKIKPNKKESPGQNMVRLPGVDDLFKNSLLAAALYLMAGLAVFNRALFADVMIYGSDFTSGAYMTYRFIYEALNNAGQFPLWYPGLYGGAPMVDAVAYGHSLYPVSLLLQKILPPNILNAWYYFIHLWLAGLGTYLFLKGNKFSGTPSFLSGIAYMFTGAMVSLIFAGHDGKIIVSSLLPWLLLYLSKAVDAGHWHRWLLWSLCSSLVIGLSLLSPHVQMTYYLLLAGFFFAIGKLWRRHRRGEPIGKTSLIGLTRGAIILLFGFSLYAVQAIPLNHYLKFSPRGQDKGYQFATSYSMPPEEIINIVWPEFSGMIDKNSEQGPTHWYWGRRDLKLHTEYIGVITVLLAILGLIYNRRKQFKLFFLLLAGFALVVAFGGFTPLYYLVYYLIPGMSKFRSPAMIFNLFSFSVVVLLAMGIQALLDGDCKFNVKRGLLASLIIALLAGIIFSLSREAMTSILSPFAAKGWGAQALWQSYPEMIKGYWVSFFILVAAIVILLLLINGRIPFKWWAAITALLIFLELWRVDAKFIKIVSGPHDYFARDQVVETLQKDLGLFRTWPLQIHQHGNYLSLFGVQTVGGEHPNPLRRYNEFVGTDPKRLLPDFHNLFQSPNYLNILNVKYLLMQQPLNHPGFILTDSCYQGRVRVYRNLNVLPRAWVVGSYEKISQDQEILERMKQPGFDPTKSVIVEEDLVGFVPSDEVTGRVSIDSYQPNRVMMTAETDRNGILVMSDNHYPAWQAWLDGMPVKVYRANYTFRAITLPAGRHQVEFRYSSRYFVLGLTISIISAIMILSGIIILAILGRDR